MEAIVEEHIKDIITTIHRYEESEIELNETLNIIKKICEAKQNGI